MNTIRTASCLAVIASHAALAAPACADGTCLEFDALLGTLPERQGWQVTASGPGEVTAVVQGDALYFSSLPFANATCPGPPEQSQYQYWSSDRPFEFGDGAAFEVEVKVLQCEYGINPCEGWARPGFAISLQDSAGRNFWVGVGESKVFLANSPYLDFGAAGLVEALFDTTDGFHIYRLEVLGSSATLRVDGQALLTLATFGAALPPGSFAYVGDGTSWSNCETLIRRFALELGPCCDADLNGDGMVDGADLGILLGNWNAPGAGDLDGSGAVGGADLGLLLGAWGACL